MVAKNYRDGFCFLEVVKGLISNMKRMNFSFSFGFPNDNSYKVFKLIKAKDIGRLDVYCLPYRIGGIKKNLGFLTPLSISFSWIWVWLCHWGGCRTGKVATIHKNDDCYNKFRYQRTEYQYRHILYNGVEFYYCIALHNDIRCAFLIDVKEKSQRSFKQAIWYILRHSHREIDIILYIGKLSSIGAVGLLKIPRRFEPKHFYVTGCLYDTNIISESLFYNIDSWDLNLSNYDLV